MKGLAERSLYDIAWTDQINNAIENRKYWGESQNYIGDEQQFTQKTISETRV